MRAGFERGDTTLDAGDLTLGAHTAPAERSGDGELAVELLKLPVCGLELGVGRRVHGRPLYAAEFGEPAASGAITVAMNGIPAVVVVNVA